MAGKENLIPLNQQTKEKQREIQKKGGIASGVAKREKKQMREILEMIGQEETTNSKGETRTKKEVVCLQLYNQAMTGNLRAVDLLSKLTGEQTNNTNINLPPTPEEIEKKAEMTAGALDMVRKKAEEITEMLKQQGRYSVEYKMQINLVAQLGVKADMMFAQTMLPDYTPINVQISREGNEREQISAKEMLYRGYASQFQSALKALGLNTDSKPVKDSSDNLNDFFAQMENEE